MSTKQFPSTIKALQISQHGGPEVIQLNDVPFPEPDSTQILIRMLWGGVNFIDTYVRSGIYPKSSFPFTAGHEGSGVIEKLPTDQAVLDDPNYKSRGYKVGDTVSVFYLGAFAEYIVQPWTYVIPVPSTIDPKFAAASTTQGLTTITFTEEAYKAKAGEWVLVHAAAGGLGLTLCQILSSRGVHVIGSVSTDEKAALAKENGAEIVIVYKKEKLIDRVLEITKGEGVAAVYDGVGKSTWEGNFDMIKRKGTIVAIGNASGVVPPFSVLKLVAKNVHLVRPTMANYLYTAEEINHYYPELWEAIESKALKIHVFKEYPFTAEGLVQADNDITGGKTTGKLLVKISD